ncbi:uncharacterized protein B0J16DRAFT_350365 [Fusarium flagelliforme]|uniref:uncharacterized protein n=1 Tax=Fusarium flagelliforme TaxID=2675880 RepID=UPI001E8DACB0|nr:uncharacterized protein B0J16DRAFT_350365 [Fusarium flagelliforme]KAH7173541.1 hypothetical protein B0J16DRAFT_350365 [Fusarium flagelliforme]
MTSQKSRMASILSLPLHLVADVLRLLDGIHQLPPILFSHRIFYSALLDTPSLPLDILRTQIPKNLFFLAIATHRSQKSVGDSSGMGVQGFRKKCCTDSPDDIGGNQLIIPVGNALQIAHIHDVVLQLRDEFTLRSLRKLHGLSKDDCIPYDQELSLGESYRVARAFYRFQIYTNLFAESQEDPDLFAWYESDGEETTDEAEEDIPSPLKDQKYLFFDQHQPCVNEQLACVYNFLETRITGAMLTISSVAPTFVNDIHGGGNLTEWLDERSQLFEEQRCLSIGLPRLTRLLKSKTLEEWQSCLDESGNVGRSCLEEDIQEFNQRKRPSENRGIWRMEDMEQLARDVGADSDADVDNVSDDHPRKMWTKVYFDQTHGRFRLGDHVCTSMKFIYELRSVGYVMWDEARMQKDVCKVNLSKAYRGIRLVCGIYC